MPLTNLAFAQSWALWLLPLALLPLVYPGQTALAYSSLSLLPPDPLSRRIDWGLRCLHTLALALIALGMAGPYLQGQWVEKIGVGAHIVLLIDRSSSMNENFSGTYMGGTARETKSALAAKLLAELVSRRPHDGFAVVAFSSAPMHVLPLTQDHAAVQAALRALGGRGHGITHIAPGMAMALAYFRGQPVTGSRVVLLVSDGAARMEPEAADAIRQQLQDTQAALYWVYLRNPKGGKLTETPKNPNESTTPEYYLHQYFQSLHIPYHAFEADNPKAMQQAIAQVESLENQPLHYREKLPKQDMSGYCFGLAMPLVLLLLAMQTLEVKTWHT